MADDEKSNNQILQVLDVLSHTLYPARATRRTTSLALPRNRKANDDGGGVAVPAELRPLSRRLSMMSPFRLRSKHDKHGKDDDDDDEDDDDDDDNGSQSFSAATPGAVTATEKKKGIWGWKPIRTLSHIGKQRVGCLFSVEVVAAQGLPPSMNGLRLAVAVRRKESRKGTVQTMPARVQKGAADFNEKLYVQCHIYCNGGGGATGKPLRFEPRPFLISAVAMDAPELDFGQNAVDLSSFVKEFKEKCQQGLCPRQWNMTFPLAGKATGGDLVVNLAFHIMDNGGLGLINSQPDVADKTANSSSSSSFARRLSKSSFRIMSPKIERPPRGSLPGSAGSTLETQATAAPIPRSPPCHRQSPAREASVRAGMAAVGLFRRLGARPSRI